MDEVKEGTAKWRCTWTWIGTIRKKARIGSESLLSSDDCTDGVGTIEGHTSHDSLSLPGGALRKEVEMDLRSQSLIRNSAIWSRALVAIEVRALRGSAGNASVRGRGRGRESGLQQLPSCATGSEDVLRSSSRYQCPMHFLLSAKKRRTYE